jgi:hypothetical protein
MNQIAESVIAAEWFRGRQTSRFEAHFTEPMGSSSIYRCWRVYREWSRGMGIRPDSVIEGNKGEAGHETKDRIMLHIQ